MYVLQFFCQNRFYFLIFYKIHKYLFFFNGFVQSNAIFVVKKKFNFLIKSSRILKTTEAEKMFRPTPNGLLSIKKAII